MKGDGYIPPPTQESITVNSQPKGNQHERLAEGKPLLNIDPHVAGTSNAPFHHSPSRLPRPKSEKNIISPSVPRHLQSGLSKKISSRIDPSQIPRPKKYHKETVYHTRSSSIRRNPPSVNSLYIGVDNGNSLPQHVRPTVVAPPSTKEMFRRVELPYSIYTTPFAALNNGEDDIAVIDMEFPIRCSKCSGYLNPSVRFSQEGRKWTCVLCNTLNSVPDWYYSPLDGGGLRLDHDRRPELCKGSVEYLVSSEYSSKPLREGQIVVFAVDVSHDAFVRGVTAAAIHAVKKAIYQLLDDETAYSERFCHHSESESFQSGRWNSLYASQMPSNLYNPLNPSRDRDTKPLRYHVGVFGFSSHLHFYDVDLKGKETVKILSAEVEDPFSALPREKWIFPLSKNLAEIEHFVSNRWLEILEKEFDPTLSFKVPPASSTCPAAAISAMREVLDQSGGGRLYVFTSNHSLIGFGQHQSRQRDYLYGQPEECLMYTSPPLIDLSSQLAARYLASNPSTAPLSLLRTVPSLSQFSPTTPSTPVILAATAPSPPPPSLTVSATGIHPNPMPSVPWKEQVSQWFDLYKQLGHDCLERNISVSVFFFEREDSRRSTESSPSSAHSDVTLLGEVARITGGKLFLFSDPIALPSSRLSPRPTSTSPPPPPLSLPNQSHLPPPSTSSFPPPPVTSASLSITPSSPPVLAQVSVRSPTFLASETAPFPASPPLLTSPYSLATSVVAELQLLRDLHEWIGSDAVVKLRTSSSIATSQVIGPGHFDSLEGVLHLADLSRSTSLLFDLAVVQDVADEEKVHFQVAVLFTNLQCQRVLRVHNLTLISSNKGQVIFRNCDVEAVAATLAKFASLRAMSRPLTDEKEGPKAVIHNRAVEMLAHYRKLCSVISSPKGQLILPESLKTLPMYCLGMFKHPFLVENSPISASGSGPVAAGPSQGLFATANERFHHNCRVQRLPIRDIINSIYPRVFSLFAAIDDPLSTFDENLVASTDSLDSIDSAEGRGDGLPAPLASHSNSSLNLGAMNIGSFSASFSSAASSAVGISMLNDKDYFNRLKLSQPINPSSENFESDQIYVLDDRSRVWLYVGRAVPQDLLEEIFDFPSKFDRSERMQINVSSKLGRRAEEFLQLLCRDGSDQPEMRVIWADSQSSLPSIHRFTSRLIEDANNGMMSYVDYLCNLHARMQGKYK